MTFRKATGEGLSAVGIAVVAVLALFALSIGGVAAASLYSKLTANTRGQTDVREKTVANGNYRIQAYDHFYDACSAIQGTEATIASIKALIAGPPALTGDELAQEHTFLVTNVANRVAAIRAYNTDARKAGTIGQFRASDLPFEIDPTEESTTC